MPLYDVHDFMLDHSDELSNGAKQIPAIREHVESLPKTSATFELGHVDADIHHLSMKDEYIEMVGAWPVHEVVGAPSDRRVFVNPNYVHAHRYTDLITECGCGEYITRNYEDGNNPLMNPHDHTDDCKPQWRLRARADIAEMREQYMRRLGPMGWQRNDFAPRFGMKSGSSVGGLPQEYNTSFTHFRNEYRRLTGNTYIYLTRNTHTRWEDIAEIYGHVPATLSQWSRKYSDYTKESGDVVEIE